MSTLSAPLRDATIRWIADDPHEGDKAELQALLARAIGTDPAAIEELTERLAAPLSFGTAGLRGPLRAGPAGMNLAVVRRAASGLGAHLQNSGDKGGLVIVGHDARHRSREFAVDVAGVLAAQGFRVLLAPGALPTPVTAFATRALGAAAGIQITASHNPPQDNGMKVYLRGGSQLVSPEDSRIEAAIAAARPAVSIEADGTPEPWPADLYDRYLAAVAAVRPVRVPDAVTTPADTTAAAVAPAPEIPAVSDGGALAPIAAPTPVSAPTSVDDPAPLADPAPIAEPAVLAAPAAAARPLRIAATPMHGVGGQTLLLAMARAGFTDVHLVPEQTEPDPDFPTVVFPNPEEPGACDLLLALATSIDADVAIANDPDADRCAVATPTREGGWRLLTGDETGLLLGDHVLRHLDRSTHPDPLVATTIVSSQALSAVATAHGSRYDETLTGFKWIVRAGDGSGTGMVFGYEEALGLCVDPGVVRDKDGISAAVMFADLVEELRGQGRTVLDALDDIARRDGLFVTGQVSVRVSDLSLITDAMARLRRGLPGALGGDPLVSATDLLPRTDGIVIHTATARVVIRPSGTEPKLKAYLQVRAEVPEGGDLVAIRGAAQDQLAALKVAVQDLLGL